MDSFKKQQLHFTGACGLKCKYCGYATKVNRGKKVNKGLNRMARARVRAETDKDIKYQLYEHRLNSYEPIETN